jgi:hypothetical protein
MRTMFSRSTIQVWTSACEVWLWTYRVQRVRFLGPSGLQSAEHAMLDLRHGVLVIGRRRRRVVAKASGCRAKPIRASSSPRSSAARQARATSTRTSTAPAATWKTHQGVPARSLCRPHLGRHHARQPNAAMVCFNGLYPVVCLPAHRPCRNRIGRRHGTIRLKLLKIGARARVPVRRIRIAMATACPAADDWGRAAKRPAPCRPDTRRRGAAHAQHHPQAHRDPIKCPATQSAIWRHQFLSASPGKQKISSPLVSSIRRVRNAG